jgi:hypothetical protein
MPRTHKRKILLGKAWRRDRARDRDRQAPESRQDGLHFDLGLEKIQRKKKRVGAV